MIYLVEERAACYAATSGEVEELHEFAAQIGLTLYQFQAGLPRYEFSIEQKELALSVGAVEVEKEELRKRCWVKLFRKHVSGIGIAWYHEDYRKRTDQLGVRIRISRNQANGVRCYPREYFNPSRFAMRCLLELAWNYQFSSTMMKGFPRLSVRPYRNAE